MNVDVPDNDVETRYTTKEEQRMSETSNRGFASMDDEKQREIASKGGKAAHEKGTAHEFTSEEAREAGRKGGESVSEDREHMSDIGKKGGETVSKDREHMSDIGREGGKQSHKNE
jgi:general stress protein YciG